MLCRQDDLTSTLFLQCQQSQNTVQRIIETAGDNEALLFEALSVNDELQKVLSKYEQLKKPPAVNSTPQPAVIPVAVEPEDSPRVSSDNALIRKPAGARGRSSTGDNLDDIDEMIFSRKGGSTSEDQDPKKQQKQQKDDLLSF